jgi:hypothetical protein
MNSILQVENYRQQLASEKTQVYAQKPGQKYAVQEFSLMVNKGLQGRTLIP